MIKKQKLRQALLETIEEKLLKLTEDIECVDDSAKEETKSSAGDKYETSRGMI